MPARMPFSDELSAAVGAAAKATLLGSSPRSRVWRADIRGGDRVIVKQITNAGGTGCDGDVRYAGDRA